MEVYEYVPINFYSLHCYIFSTYMKYLNYTVYVCGESNIKYRNICELLRT